MREGGLTRAEADDVKFKLRLVMWAFPDLERIPDDANKREAWKRARADVRRSWAFRVPHWLMYTSYFAAMVYAIRYQDRRVWTSALILGLVFLMFVPLESLIYRRAIHRSLWRWIAEHGIPCCVSCGYDLTGNSSAKCPECGKAI